MKGNNIYKEEITIRISQVYYYSFLFLIPIGILFIVPFFLVWGKEISRLIEYLLLRVKSDWSTIFFYLDFLKKFSLLLLILILGALIHELLHGCSWLLLSKKKLSALKIGIMVQDMSPYIHCKVPLPVWVYRIGVVLPGIVLGFLPAIIGLIIGGSLSFLASFIAGSYFTFFPSSDLYIFLISFIGFFVVLISGYVLVYHLSKKIK